MQNSRRCLHAAQGIVVFEIFKTAVNAGSMENFSRKKTLHFVPKSC